MLWNISLPEVENSWEPGRLVCRRELITQGNVVHARIPLIGHAGRRIGIEHIGRGLGRGSGKDVIALISEVREAQQLALDALDLRNDGRAIGGVDRTVGAFTPRLMACCSAVMTEFRVESALCISP